MSGGRITTHVLDIAHAKPAGSMKVRLWRLEEAASPLLLKSALLNGDGRLDEPLIGGELEAGTYELVFEAGDYYMERWNLDSPFLDLIPVRFKVTDAEAHYHVPLLVSPGGYSTYRGT